MQNFVSLWWLWLIFLIVGYGTSLTAIIQGHKSPDLFKNFPAIILGGFMGSAGFLCLAAIFLLKLAGRI
jgi:hypothetical protein